MPKYGRARKTPNPNSMVVKRQLNAFTRNQPASIQVLRAELAAGGIGGVKGEGGTKLTLGDSVVNDNNGNITIKSNTSSESKVSAVNNLN